MTLKTTAYGSMQPVEFRAYHGPALELQEVKHGLILNALGQLGGEKSVEVSYWTLGRPGECTIRMGHHLIVLGALDEKQCRNLADLTAHTDYPGVIGPDMTPKWFTDRARELGLQFLEPEPQQILLDQRQAPVSGSVWAYTTGHDRGCAATSRLADCIPPRSRPARSGSTPRGSRTGCQRESISVLDRQRPGCVDGGHRTSSENLSRY